MKIVTFLRKNGHPAKRVVDFPMERDTFRNKIMEIVEDFDETSYNNNGTPWKSLRILSVNPIFFIRFFFFVFSFFFSFFPFFHFFLFSCNVQLTYDRVMGQCGHLCFHSRLKGCVISLSVVI